MTFQFGTSATAPTAVSTATGATTARVATAAGFRFRGNTTTTTGVTTTATAGATVTTTSMTGNNNRPRETELKIQTSDDFIKKSYVTTCATAFIRDHAVGAPEILLSGTSIQKWIKQPPNEHNMVYVNLMDVNKSRGYINDDSIVPVENWCHIDESDDDDDDDEDTNDHIRITNGDDNGEDDSGGGNVSTERKKQKTQEGIQTALMMVNYIADPGKEAKNFVTDVTGKKRVVMMKLTRQPNSNNKNNNNKSDTHFNVTFNPHRRYKDRFSEHRSDTLNMHLKPFLEGRQEFEDFKPESMNNMGKSETASFLYCAQTNFVDSLDADGNSPLHDEQQIIMLVGDNERLNEAIIKLAKLNTVDAEKFRKIEWKTNDYEVLFYDKVNRLLWGIVKDEGCERSIRYKKDTRIEKTTMGSALKKASKILRNY